MGAQGVLSEYAKVANYAVSVVPKSVSPEKVATLPCADMTVLISLERLQLIEGDTLLIEAGAGDVGQIAIQFAKQLGVAVFTTTAKRNHKLVKTLGGLRWYLIIGIKKCVKKFDKN
jgi:NADPH:quinone reductase-like Zn-dependent oxidoreductase